MERWLGSSSPMHEASLVAGLHPDSAALALVKVALALAKPFAVVPCCVFPNSISELQQNGVRSYAHFLDYIQSLDQRIQRMDLPFAGRCTVLWMSAEDAKFPTMPIPVFNKM